MELGNCSAALFVKDIEVSRKFYSELPGLQIDMDFGKNVIFKNGFAIWEIQESHIIPQTLGTQKISGSDFNRFELYFETEDLISLYERLKIKNVRFLHGLHEEPWGQRTIRFFDPDNHLIEIGESLKHFVTRFFRQGMTIEEVSRRTSVPREEVSRLIRENEME